MKGCADRQRKQQLLLGGSSHTGARRVEEGERKFKSLIYQSYKSRLVTTNIHHCDRQTGRQTDLRALQVFLTLTGTPGGIYKNI